VIAKRSISRILLAGVLGSLLAGTAITFDSRRNDRRDQSQLPLPERSLLLPASSVVQFETPVDEAAVATLADEVEFSDPASPVADRRALPISNTRTCDPIRVMPLGDSLTSYPDSYRGPMYRSLQAAGWNVDFVGTMTAEPLGGGDPNHEGHGGYRIGPDPERDFEGNAANLADRIEGWLTGQNPEVILLNIGTNDIGAGGTTAATAPARLTKFVDSLRRLVPGAQVVVGGLPPNGWSDAGKGLVRDAAGGLVPGTPEMVAISAAGASAATAHPGSVQFVPVFERLITAGFDPTPGLGTSDNTHFSLAGGEQFATALLPETIEALQRVRRC
jgi:lysophospholipase L1-like esterase